MNLFLRKAVLNTGFGDTLNSLDLMSSFGDCRCTCMCQCPCRLPVLLPVASTDFNVLVHLWNWQSLLLASILPAIFLSMSFSKQYDFVLVTF